MRKRRRGTSPTLMAELGVEIRPGYWEARLIREGAPLAGTQVRPRVPLQIDRSHTVVMGIHLGPRTGGVVLMGLDGVEHASVLVPHAGMSAAESLDLVVCAARELIERVVLSTENTFSLSLFAAAIQGAAVLDDPLGFGPSMSLIDLVSRTRQQLGVPAI